MKTNQPANIATWMRAMERRMAAVERGRPLANSVVSQGSWEVRDPDGNILFKAGEFTVGASTVYGVGAYRRNGTLQMLSWDNAAGAGYLAVYDEAGNIIFSTDTVSGQGIARPYIPLPVVPYAEVLTPSVLTTSATFTPLHRIHSTKQQPWIRVRVVTKVDAGTTGEIRLAVAGVAISDVTALPDGDFSYRTLTAAVAGAHLTDVQVDIEARRGSGAGNVRVLACYALGRQS